MPVSRAVAIEEYKRLHERLATVDNLEGVVSFDNPTGTFQLLVPSPAAIDQRPELGSAATVADVEAAIAGVRSEVTSSITVGLTDEVPEDMACQRVASGWIEGGRTMLLVQDDTTCECYTV